MCGIKDVKRLMFKEVVRSTEKNRDDWLEQVRNFILEEDEI
jgi:putative NADPH-quinone reductase